MFKRNLYKYLDNQQNPDDIYYKYRKYKEKMRLQFEAQEIAEYLYDEVAVMLSEEIQKVLNNQ